MRVYEDTEDPCGSCLSLVGLTRWCLLFGRDVFVALDCCDPIVFRATRSVESTARV